LSFSNNRRAIMPPTTPVAPTTRIILHSSYSQLHDFDGSLRESFKTAGSG
jgi:hypothetical protein